MLSAKAVDGPYYLNQIICGGFLNEADQAYGWTQDGRPAWIFQQDNARPHISRNVVNTMESMGIQILKRWPPYSPDLNIIERIIFLEYGQL
jgi:hypothetical protein